MSPGGFRRLFRLSSRRARDIDADLRDEIDAHIALAVEALVRRGVDPATALERTRARFGDFDTSMRTLAHSARQREGRMQRREWIDIIRRDLTYSLRQLRRSPGFTAAVAITIALGIGANAVMFGIVDRLLLSPPPHVEDASGVVRIHYHAKWPNGPEATIPVTNWATYRDMANVPSFAAVGAFGFPRSESIGRGREAIPVQVNGASASYFPLLGVRPALGRFFLDDEDQLPAGSAVAVLGYGFWRRQFGGSGDVLGRKLPIGDQNYTVVGVAPRGFTGVDLKRVDVWLPMTAFSYADNRQFATDRGSLWLRTVARMAPTAARDAAQEQAFAALRQGYEAAGSRHFIQRIELTSVIAARGPGDNNDAKVAAWLLGVAGMVLLIACANVATLLLARALSRQQETAVRLALGMSRRRLLLQVVADSVLLAVLGAAAAMLTAQFAGGALQAWLLPDVAIESGFLTRRVITIVLGAVVVAGVLIALGPALQTRRVDLSLTLKAGGRTNTGGRSRARTALLVLQTAMSVMLMIGSGLFVRSLRNAESLRLGLDAERLILGDVNFSFETVPFPQQDAFWTTAIERVRTVPSVERATLTITTPFNFSMSGEFRVPGIDSLPSLETGGPYRNGVSADYFATLGTRILRGRPFTDGDRRGSPSVAVINETMARLAFGGRDPLGTCVKIYRTDSIPCATVIGVAEDVRRFSLIEGPTMQYYLPIDQWRGPHSTALIVRARSGDDLTRVATAVRRELQGIHDDAPFPQVRPYEELIDPQRRAWKLGAVMFTMFGALAFIVAMVGLYGLLAYSVAQRRFEFGVRVALGAQARHIARMVVTYGLAAMLTGLVAGLALAAIAGRWTAALLFQVGPRDVAVYIGVAVLVIIATLLAAVVPSRRAARTDPLEALRAE
jgi:putative ABC transport system permease protein